MRKVLAGILLGVLVAVGSLVGTSTPAGAASAGDEAAFVSKINALRQSKGLGTLAVSGELTSIGRAWSERMLAAGAISHNPSFPSQVSANWLKLGENVGHGGSVDSLFQAFVNSPAHYKNLVDPDFTHVGVGVVVGPDGSLWTAHQFMRLATSTAAAARPAPAPKPAAAPRVASPKPAAPKPAAAAAPAAAPVAPPAPPAPTVRIVLSLENLRGLAAA